MKKTNKLFFGSLVAAFIILAANNTMTTTFAGGGGVYIDTVTASPSSAVINSTITIDAYIYNYKCSIPDGNGIYTYVGTPSECATYGSGTPIETAVGGLTRYIEVSGSGNTVSPASIDANASGHAYFTVTSSVAEAKTVTIYEPGKAKRSSTTITFNAPASTPAPSSTKKTTTTTPAPTPIVNPPASLTPESIQVDGKAVTADQKVTIQQDKPLVLTGKTVPNGVVTLYIFSEPQKYTVTADKEGSWTYTVKGLEPGAHHIETEVTDPATGKTSTRAQLLAFSVTKPIAPVATATSAQTTVSPKKNPLTIAAVAVGAIVVLVTLALIGLWKFKPATLDAMLRKMHVKKTGPPPPGSFS
jgi:hypothetical protein